MKAHEILSGRTALYTNIGFNSPVTFVKELENALSVHNKQLYDSYQSSRKKIEGLFGISLEENFFELDVRRVCYYPIRTRFVRT